MLYLSHTNHVTAHETLVDDNAYQSDIGRHFVGSVTILWWTIMSKKTRKRKRGLTLVRTVSTGLIQRLQLSMDVSS